MSAPNFDAIELAGVDAEVAGISWYPGDSRLAAKGDINVSPKWAEIAWIQADLPYIVCSDAGLAPSIWKQRYILNPFGTSWNSLAKRRGMPIVMFAATALSDTQFMENEAIDIELEWVRKIAAGDKKAFENLFRLYHPRVYRFSFKMVHDHHVAEEVVCDTLYAVWNSAAKFKEQSAVSTWIFGIAYRRSLKSFRQHSRHSEQQESGIPLEEMEESAPDTNPETHANNELSGRQLIAGLANLSIDHRAVLELTALGHTIPEISRIVGCPENTVKTRTFHARQKLRSAMQV